ncbi:MAG: glutamate--cysteine ligase [Candidatus Methylumidiphilus sp.]
MGQEIHRIHFDTADFARFDRQLAEETALLGTWLSTGRFAQPGHVGGFELEGWLLNRQFAPAPINQAFLERLASPLVVPELAQFNVELNGTPQPLVGRAFALMESELAETWRHCLRVAAELDSGLALIGILPTVEEAHLSLANISPFNRFHALNAEILKRRGGVPLHVRIDGRDRLELRHDDVMLEAATTSFQVHLQTPLDTLARHYNAAQILSAPLLAVSANSPFLFGRQLWEETRIPLFEQAVDTREERRVTFGNAYLTQTPEELFADNRRFPVLLPMAFAGPPGQFCHLRLHNSTIWRWNRLLLGADSDGVPHLRIEHRALPAGPSIIDMIANAALFIGAAHSLAQRPRPPEADLPFAAARANFYRAARSGLDAELHWLDGGAIGAAQLLREELIPLAEAGLAQLGIAEADSRRYLDIIRLRVASGQNGAVWQRRHIARHGPDFCRLTETYLHHQHGGRPVHEWET